MNTFNNNLQFIEKDILEHAYDGINDRDLEDTCRDDLHNTLFNEDYFVVGYYQAQKWLNDNNIDVFDAIRYCNEKEEEMFGEVQTQYQDAERLVNSYAYFKGQELLWELNSYNDAQDDLTKQDIANMLKEIDEAINS